MLYGKRKAKLLQINSIIIHFYLQIAAPRPSTTAQLKGKTVYSVPGLQKDAEKISIIM